MQRYEHDEDYVDFHRLAIPRHEVPRSARIRGAVTGITVPIASLRFYYSAGNEEQLRQARQDGWNIIRPMLEDRLKALDAQGWQLTEPLDEGLLEITARSTVMVIALWLLATFFTLFYGRIVARHVTPVDKDQWFSYVSATLPLRRATADS